MSRRAREYTRLPGGNRGLISGATLWMAKDHLLSVETTLYAEDYRRYYYSEIEGVVLRRTRGRQLVGAALGLLTLLAWWGAASLLGGRVKDWTSLVPLAIILFLPLIVLAAYFLFGPSCVTLVKTPTGYHPLPALAGIRSARKAVARFSPLVAEAQGTIPVEELRALAGALPLPGRLPPPPLPVAGAGAKATAPAKPYQGSWHQKLFLLQLGSPALLPWFLTTTSPPVVYLVVLVGVAGMALLLTSLVRQSGTLLPREVKTATWGLLALQVLDFISAWGYQTVNLFQRSIAGNAPQLGANPFTLFTPFSDHPFLYWSAIVSGAVQAGLAAWGLRALSRRQGASAP